MDGVTHASNAISFPYLFCFLSLIALSNLMCSVFTSINSLMRLLSFMCVSRRTFAMYRGGSRSVYFRIHSLFLARMIACFSGDNLLNRARCFWYNFFPFFFVHFLTAVLYFNLPCSFLHFVSVANLRLLTQTLHFRRNHFSPFFGKLFSLSGFSSPHWGHVRFSIFINHRQWQLFYRNLTFIPLLL